MGRVLDGGCVMTGAEEAAMRASLMRLTLRDLRRVAREEGACLGYATRKADVVVEIVAHRRYVEHMRQEDQ